LHTLHCLLLLQAAVLDSLTDVVLASCSSAAFELRLRLVRVVAAGAASTAGHACCPAGTATSSNKLGADPAAAAAAAAAASLVDDKSSQAAGQVLGRQSPEPAAAEGSSANGSRASSTNGHYLHSPSRSRCASPAPNAATAVAAAQVAPCAIALCLPAQGRASQLCLRKLALLAGRGTEGSAGSMNAVMLEVAQIALPLLLERCAAVLVAYAEAEEAAMEEEEDAQQQQQQSEHGGGASSISSSSRSKVDSSSAEADGAGEQLLLEQQHGGDLQEQLQLQHKCLVEEVICVLQVLVDLQLDIAVLEDVVEQQPQVAACLHAAQHAHQYQQQLLEHQYQQHEHYKQQQQQQQHAEGGSPVLQAAGGAAAGADASGSTEVLRRQQGHLLLLYESLARCVGCRDRAVGALLRRALLAVGRQLFA
jgi:hypothetical protein